MKKLLITVALCTVVAAPAFAQPARQLHNRLSANDQRWQSTVHVYAPDHYTPRRYNGDINPDFQLGGRE
jgi:hypothetical protein